MKRALFVVEWALALGIALVFAKLGWAKLDGHEVEVRAFIRWGYPDWFRHLLGVAELVTAALLLTPWTRFYGAAMVAGTMCGAIFTYLRAGEAGSSWLPATFLCASLPLMWLTRPAWVARMLRLPARS